ncbi:chorismate synthase [Candidatus Scalindua japonica]|uniref:Chorismate synthase n=2 Tax=Candidatus Scalindua japonica TaxID=1284222 RepID=A0A286U261_9BACT|nr:chorismate synthase [Candidatus Scalindua japonica]
MKIESDCVSVLSGIRKNITIGSPICFKIENKDYKIDKLPDVTRPRPGHADLPGAIKFGHRDVRNILERASARETAARVAAGSLAKILLANFEINVLGYVKSIGGINSKKTIKNPEEIYKARNKSKVYCLDKAAESKMIEKIKKAKADGDSLGGVIEIIAFGVPAGLGSHVQWNLRLDGVLAGALMSIQAIKGVEIGLGFGFSKKFGSQVHDEIFYCEEEGVFNRTTNNAGGIEGGITNGEVLIARAAMKPIPTLMKPLRSVDIVTKKPVDASTERSDVCAVPAVSVVGESVVAFEIARCFMEKFGGDSLGEVTRNYKGYLEQSCRII